MKRKGFLLKTLSLVFSLSLLSPFAGNTIKAFAEPAQKTAAAVAQTEPNITAKSAITMDLKTGEVIYSKNASAKAYPASTTKLMTALLFAEKAQKSDQIPFTKTAKEQPPYALHSNWPGVTLNVGDTMTADDVMKGLLIFSGNDAAYMIADYVAGSKEAFSDLMNKKAKELGMNNTHFITPNGLHDDNHYTTAYDLALLTKAALSNPWIRETVGLKETTITIGNKPVKLENRNTGLGENGNLGGKTGTTTPAGDCLAALYERDGRQVIGVVLHSENKGNTDHSFREKEMNALMDYSYAQSPTAFKTNGTKLDDVTLKYKLFRFFGPEKSITVPVTLSEDAMLYKNTFNDTHAKLQYVPGDQTAWQVASNNDVNVKLTSGIYSKDLKGQVDISTMQILKANALAYLGILVAVVVILVLIIFIIRFINMRRRKRRRYSSYRRY